MGEATAMVVSDDDGARVTVWSFRPGEATGAHRHEMDYVVVPLTGGVFQVIEPSGARWELVQQRGLPYAGHVGVTHNVVSLGSGVRSFMEVELKPAPTDLAVPR